MRTVRVSGWDELQDALFSEAWNEELGRFRSPCAFRGLSDASYGLATTLLRLGGNTRELERHLLRNFKKYAVRDVVERDSIWNWLAVAQHHGVPTRLLDWTFSPYVALHFATANTQKFKIDGVVWVVNYVRAHELLAAEFRRELARERSQVFTAEMLNNVAGSLDQVDALAASDVVLFFEPPSIDDRIVNQAALFSVLSDPEAELDGCLRAHPELGWKIVIDAAMKWHIRDKLDQANINERVLFPGLDGLSSWLRRYYSPKA